MLPVVFNMSVLSHSQSPDILLFLLWVLALKVYHLVNLWFSYLIVFQLVTSLHFCSCFTDYWSQISSGSPWKGERLLLCKTTGYRNYLSDSRSGEYRCKKSNKSVQWSSKLYMCVRMHLLSCRTWVLFSVMQCFWSISK